MPKIVDWDERRDEILSATWRVIARDGIAGATIRAIAKEANCSRGILGHYFDDKADILGSALVLSHRRVGARMAQASAGLTGLDALRAVMLEALPLDERRDLEAQIEISFWGRALGNARLRDLQHSEFDRLCGRLRGHLQRGRAARRARPPTAISAGDASARRAHRRPLGAARAVPGPGDAAASGRDARPPAPQRSGRPPGACRTRGECRRRPPTRVSVTWWPPAQNAPCPSAPSRVTTTGCVPARLRRPWIGCCQPAAMWWLTSRPAPGC